MTQPRTRRDVFRLAKPVRRRAGPGRLWRPGAEGRSAEGRRRRRLLGEPEEERQGRLRQLARVHARGPRPAEEVPAGNRDLLRVQGGHQREHGVLRQGRPRAPRRASRSATTSSS
ncbi:hypothetical protein ACFSTC_45155 [Nonomuraea ferruginea]